MKTARLLAAFLLAASVATAQTAKSRTDLYAEISANLPTNGTGQITAAALRAVVNDIVASTFNPTSDQAITLGGPLTLLGSYSFAGALAGPTSITFPTGGTLISTSGFPGLGQLLVSTGPNGATSSSGITTDGAGNVSVAGTGTQTVGGSGSVTLANRTYGGIYIDDGSTGQSIPNGATQTQVTTFNTAAGHNGLSNDVTPSYTTNSITVTRAGTYRIWLDLSEIDGTNNVTWRTTVYVNGVRLPNVEVHQKIGTGGDMVCGSATGVAAIGANQSVTVWVSHDNGSAVTLTIQDMNLTLERIGN